MKLLNKSWRVLQEDGFIAFLVGVYRFLRWKLASLGDITLSIDGTEARFVADSRSSVNTTKNRLAKESDQILDTFDEIQSDDVFYDIGANTGLYSCFIAQKCQRVIGFEPYPPNVNELERNAKKNGENISVLNVALSDTSGTIDFSVPEDPSPGHGTASIAKEDGNRQIRTVAGDQLINDKEIPPPNIVKIDVEGAEWLVVNGLKNAFTSKKCRVVYCEVHFPTDNSSRGSIYDYDIEISDIISRFEEWGYEVEKMEAGRGGTTTGIKAKRG